MNTKQSHFEAYGKIAESAGKWGLDAAAYRRLSREKWAVTEKAHGANFCFVCEAEGRVRGASRRELLPEDHGFFGWQGVRDRIRPQLAAVFDGATRLVPGLCRVYVYGELFGGAYPHPDVPATPGAQPVQTGVWYAPDVRFCAFDLTVVGAEGRRYLDYEAAVRVWEKAGLFHAAPLRVCGYAEALAYPLGFDSTLPRRLGLPPLPSGMNRAEGVVVRPLREVTMETPDGPARPLLKRKIAEFAEDVRYVQARRWEGPPVGAPPEVAALTWEAAALVNDNRVAAAVSKVGYPEARRDPSRARLVFRLVADEVWEELAVTAGTRLTSLPPDKHDALQGHVAAAVRTALRRHAERNARRL